MAIKPSSDKKAPSQNPTAFYQSKQQGGAHGSPSSVGDTLSGGPQREKVMGRDTLRTQSKGG